MIQRRYSLSLTACAMACLSFACSSSSGSDNQSAAGGSTNGSSSPSTGGTGSGATTVASSGGGSTGGTSSVGTLDKFSFFVTSEEVMFQLANSTNGFGGDLRYGEANGLAGADKICATIAEISMPGAGAKGWRAFLSATAGADGKPVNAIDRIGNGPWYDRLGRLVAPDKASLQNPRPAGGNANIVNDLPNENGVQNSIAKGQEVNNHDTLTGSDARGMLGSFTRANTCNDWTTVEPTAGQPQVGHSWPRSDGMSWISAHQAPGCAAGASEIATSGGLCVGCMGGYGGFYCFALTP